MCYLLFTQPNRLHCIAKQEAKNRVIDLSSDHIVKSATHCMTRHEQYHREAWTCALLHQKTGHITIYLSGAIKIPKTYFLSTGERSTSTLGHPTSEVDVIICNFIYYNIKQKFVLPSYIDSWFGTSNYPPGNFISRWLNNKLDIQRQSIIKPSTNKNETKTETYIRSWYNG